MPERSSPKISTARRLEYTKGYLELGMLAEAAGELENIAQADRLSVEVLEIRILLHSERKEWEPTIACAQQLTQLKPNEPQGWISWAYATRRHIGIEAAESILLKAPATVSASCAIIPYNLACYHCVHGDITGAREYLATAYKIDPRIKAMALDDPDLKPMRDAIAEMQ
jgi:Flp pilus assembly protein TadD